MIHHMVILCLIFLKNSHTVFHSGYIIFHSHQQCTWVSISPHPCQHLLFFCIVPILMCMKWYLVVLLCISLMTSDVVHLFMCLLGYLHIFEKKSLFEAFALNEGFLHSSVGKESACSAGDPGLIPGWERSAGEGIGYPIQYSWASLVAQLVKSPPAMRETWA